MSNSSSSIVRGTTFILFSQVTGGVITFLISIAVARYLGPERFGLYALLVSIQGVVGIFAGFGLSQAIAKYVAQSLPEKNDASKHYVEYGLLLFLLFSAISCMSYVVLSGLIGNNLYHEHSLVGLIPYSSMVVLSSAMYTITFGIAQGCRRIKMLSSMQITVPVISLVLIISFISHFEIRGVLFSVFLSQMTVSIAVLLWLRRNVIGFTISPTASRDTRYLRDLWSFAVPAVLASVVVIPVLWLGNTELTLTEGLTALGYFSVAVVIYQALAVVPNALVIPLVPSISELAQRDRSKVDAFVVKALHSVSVVFFPLFLGTALFSSNIIRLFYGDSYLPSSNAAYLMVTASYFLTLVAVVGALVAGLGKMWVGLALNGIWGLVFVVFSLTAVPIYGVVGLGATFAVSYCLHVIVSYAVAEKILGINVRSAFPRFAVTSALFAVGFVTVSGTTADGFVPRLMLLALGGGLVLWVWRKDALPIFRIVFTGLGG
jgi:O-antigen/teichoic acid export membrane protein